MLTYLWSLMLMGISGLSSERDSLNFHNEKDDFILIETLFYSEESKVMKVSKHSSKATVINRVWIEPKVFNL